MEENTPEGTGVQQGGCLNSLVVIGGGLLLLMALAALIGKLAG